MKTKAKTVKLNVTAEERKHINNDPKFVPAPPARPKLRIWWIPQVPKPAGAEGFYVDVNSLREAKLLLETLAKYDLYQYQHRIKPDYANAGGLEVQEPDGEWCDWYNEEGQGIDDLELKDL